MQWEEARNVLQRFAWQTDITIASEISETWFPPYGLSISGIALYRRNDGYWATLGRDGNEIVETSFWKTICAIDSLT